ncbi:MAG: YCF48-related protein [Candidatus Dormibacteria bacterium]
MTHRRGTILTLLVVIAGLTACSGGNPTAPTQGNSTATPSPRSLVATSPPGTPPGCVAPGEPTPPPALAPGPVSVDDLRMVTPSVGWGVVTVTPGAAGGVGAGAVPARIVRTTDGGLHWSDVSPGGAVTSAMAVLSADEAFVAGAAAYVVPVEGCGWQPAPAPIFHTIDGGAHWSQLAGQLPLAAAEVDELFFLDREHGWALDASGCATQCEQQGAALASTVDGGRHWSLVAATGLGYPPQPPVGRLTEGCSKFSLAFMTASTGILGTACGGDVFQFLLTFDGGRTWSEEDLHPDSPIDYEITSAAAVSKEDAFIFAAEHTSQLYATHDGFRTWQRVSLPEGLTDPPDFITAADGFVLGSRLYRTVSGGKSWTPVASNLDLASQVQGYQAVGLDFVTTSVGFAVRRDPATGAITNLYRTDDGGREWQELHPLFVDY